MSTPTSQTLSPIQMTREELETLQKILEPIQEFDPLFASAFRKGCANLMYSAKALIGHLPPKLKGRKINVLSLGDGFPTEFAVWNHFFKKHGFEMNFTHVGSDEKTNNLSENIFLFSSFPNFRILKGDASDRIKLKENLKENGCLPVVKGVETGFDLIFFRSPTISKLTENPGIEIIFTEVIPFFSTEKSIFYLSCSSQEALEACMEIVLKKTQSVYWKPAKGGNVITYDQDWNINISDDFLVYANVNDLNVDTNQLFLQCDGHGLSAEKEKELLFKNLMNKHGVDITIMNSELVKFTTCLFIESILYGNDVERTAKKIANHLKINRFGLKENSNLEEQKEDVPSVKQEKSRKELLKQYGVDASKMTNEADQLRFAACKAAYEKQLDDLKTLVSLDPTILFMKAPFSERTILHWAAMSDPKKAYNDDCYQFIQQKIKETGYSGRIEDPMTIKDKKNMTPAEYRKRSILKKLFKKYSIEDSTSLENDTERLLILACRAAYEKQLDDLKTLVSLDPSILFCVTPLSRKTIAHWAAKKTNPKNVCDHRCYDFVEQKMKEISRDQTMRLMAIKDNENMTPAEHREHAILTESFCHFIEKYDIDIREGQDKIEEILNEVEYLRLAACKAAHEKQLDDLKTLISLDLTGTILFTQDPSSRMTIAHWAAKTHPENGYDDGCYQLIKDSIDELDKEGVYGTPMTTKDNENMTPTEHREQSLSNQSLFDDLMKKYSIDSTKMKYKDCLRLAAYQAAYQKQLDDLQTLISLDQKNILFSKENSVKTIVDWAAKPHPEYGSDSRCSEFIAQKIKEKVDTGTIEDPMTTKNKKNMTPAKYREQSLSKLNQNQEERRSKPTYRKK